MRLGLLLFFAVLRAPWCQSDPQTLRVRDYFNLLTTARGPERQKLLLADISRRPISRPMIPDQDVPVLVEILNGNDPDLAASAASHLVLMALQQGGRLGEKPPAIVASALPAMASHFDDENPPVMEENADWTVHPIGSRFWRHEVLSYISALRSPPPAQLVPVITLSLTDDGLAGMAAIVLTELKPLPKPVLDGLVARIAQKPRGRTESERNRSQTVRENVMEAVAEAGVADGTLIAALASILDDPGERHSSAAEALSRLGDAARPAIPALRRIASKDPAPPYTDEAVAQSFAQRALKNLSVN